MVGGDISLGFCIGCRRIRRLGIGRAPCYDSELRSLTGREKAAVWLSDHGRIPGLIGPDHPAPRRSGSSVSIIWEVSFCRDFPRYSPDALI